MKLVRSFLGAFFGAITAIWPAATWNEPWLLLFGGVSGWLMGYHGDRLIGSLVHGWQHARRVGFQAYLVAAPKRSVLMNWTIRSARGVQFSINWLIHHVVRVSSIEVPAGRLLTAFCTWANNTFNSGLVLPRRIVTWHTAHPVNRAATIRAVAGFVMGSLTIGAIWYWTASWASPPVGSVMTDHMNKKTIVTESYAFWNQVGLTAILGGFLLCLTAILYMDERHNMRGFYQIWERYASRDSVGFGLGEAARFLWLEVWVIWTVVAGLVSMFTVWMLLMLVTLPMWSGVIYATKLSWRAVRLNRDYGVVSLCIALLVGTITFYLYRDDLVANTMFRLSASIVAGFVAGTVSFMITWLCSLLFRHSVTARRMALRKGGYFNSDDLMELLTETIPVWCWKQNKRWLPTLG